jgi:hypothetical protein
MRCAVCIASRNSAEEEKEREGEGEEEEINFRPLMFKTNTFEILKWDLIITFVTRDTKVVWLLLLIADRLLFHFGKLEQKWRGRTAWKRQMESGCDDFGKWMGEWSDRRGVHKSDDDNNEDGDDGDDGVEKNASASRC